MPTRVVDLNELVRGTEQLLHRLIGETIELTFQPLPSPATVRADPASLEQVLLDLAVNARDATPTGGRLTIALHKVELDDEYVREHPDASAGLHVVLSVTDTGAGIAAEHLPHVFEPFFTTKPHGEGTGLGLGAVHAAVQQAGGHLRLLSSPGIGTDLSVYLPYVDEPATAAVPALAPSRGGETVLLVEDEPSVRSVVARVLDRAGYQVLEAADGAEAIAVFERYPDRISAVVTDVFMPRIGGPELAARLRAMRPDLKVLLTSGYADDKGVHEQLDVHQAFLQKPYLPSTLTAKLRALLDGPAHP
jgi:two-component system cell cycle sensor histidine kinase/response regulator CckA